MSLNIAESEAATGAAVKRGIVSALGSVDPLIVAAECENPDDVPRQLREAEIAIRTAQAMSGTRRDGGPGSGY